MSKPIEKNGPYKIMQCDDGRFVLHGWYESVEGTFLTLESAQQEMRRLIHVDVQLGDLDYA